MNAEKKNRRGMSQQYGGIDPEQARLLHEMVTELTNYDVAQAIQAISEKLKKEDHNTHVTCTQLLARVPDVISK